MPAAATSQADEVAWLYSVFMAAAGAVFVTVAGLITWSVVRYRRSGRDDLPAQTAGHLRLELVWWAVPTALVIVLFAVSVGVTATVDRRADDEDDPLVVEVQGFQWGWEFRYVDADRVVVGFAEESPELVLPVGREIVLELRSSDVIHSFYVPHFLVKRDVVPGLDNRIDLTITEVGTYTGQCAEFCGLHHGEHRFSIRAVPPAEFAAWIGAPATEPTERSDGGSAP